MVLDFPCLSRHDATETFGEVDKSCENEEHHGSEKNRNNITGTNEHAKSAAISRVTPRCLPRAGTRDDVLLRQS